MQVDDKLKLSENIDILNYLVKAKLFNSPLMIREGDAPYIIKNVNLFTRDIALVPADQDASKIDLPEAAVLKIKNDRKNISFVSSIKKIHGGKLIIADIPKTIKIINERKSHR
ncbi:hypothetical protein OAT67_05230 [Bacteriovoracaceae bacterium]|nr:hypothetical protein [Bacteriovoracaceae bacterium]